MIRSHNVFVQFLHSFWVSGIGLVLDIGVLFGLTHFFGVHYLVSAACGFLAGLVLNYILSVWIVFPVRKVENKMLEFHIFGVIGVVGLVLNELGMWGLVEIGGLHYLLSKVFVAGGTFLFNFFVRRFFLFR